MNHLVFLDESGASTDLTRLYGRAPVGQRLVGKVPGGHWHTSTIIAAVRLSGAFAPAVFDGPTNREVFAAYVEQVLAKELGPGDVVVMDNLSSHKAAGIAAPIKAAGARVLYLPPYSPDFNPIECLWSKVKQHVRSLEPRTFDALCHATGKAFDAVTLDDCAGYFKNCGYAT